VAEAEFFVLRSPVCPFEQLARWADGVGAVDACTGPDDELKEK